MTLEVWCETDIGLKRSTNQDSFLVNSNLGLYVVADGMGGHMGGEVASTMAVQVVEEVVRNAQTASPPVSPRTLLLSAYREASSRIFNRTETEEPALKGMGTTLVVALYREPTLYIGNVGDSRAYLITAPHMWQLTEDHSLVNEQIRAGLLREETALQYIGRNVITRSVGFERQVECDIVERNLLPGEMVLICSDGLSGLVPDRQMVDICLNTPPAEIVPACIKAAKKNGGDDNITVLLIRASES